MKVDGLYVHIMKYLKQLIKKGLSGSWSQSFLPRIRQVYCTLSLERVMDIGVHSEGTHFYYKTGYRNNSRASGHKPHLKASIKSPRDQVFDTFS